MITFDQTPTIYWAIMYCLTVAMVVVSCSGKVRSGVVLLLGAALVLAVRLPVLLFNRELNPDESQVISHAITLWYDPLYWKSVDGTTIGPLDIFPLLIPRILGFQIDYTSIRVVGLICNLGALFFFFKACLQWFGEKVARVAVLMPLLLLSYSQEPDLIHYSSEQVPILLLAGTLFLLAKIPGTQRPKLLVFALGVVLGMLPFAKLQAVPQAALIGLTAGWVLLMQSGKKRWFRDLGLLASGAVTFPALVLAYTLSFGLFDDFLNFYLFGNAVYAGENRFWTIPLQLVQLIGVSPDFTAYALVLLLAVVVSFLKPLRNRTAGFSSFYPVFGVLYLIAGIYAVTKSGNNFGHYLHFLIYPLALIFAWAVARRDQWIWAGPVILIAWFAANDAYSFLKVRRLNSYDSVGARQLAVSPVVASMQKFTKPGDYIVVWGWQCRYYVEAQLPHGTAENHSERCIFEHPLRGVYRARYLSDIMRTRPVAFIDAVGRNSLWLNNRADQGYESFPELASYIDRHYTYQGETGGDRLFVRKDRVR